MSWLSRFRKCRHEVTYEKWDFHKVRFDDRGDCFYVDVTISQTCRKCRHVQSSSLQDAYLTIDAAPKADIPTLWKMARANPESEAPRRGWPDLADDGVVDDNAIGRILGVRAPSKKAAVVNHDGDRCATCGVAVITVTRMLEGTRLGEPKDELIARSGLRCHACKTLTCSSCALHAAHSNRDGALVCPQCSADIGDDRMI